MGGLGPLSSDCVSTPTFRASDLASDAHLAVAQMYQNCPLGKWKPKTKTWGLPFLNFEQPSHLSRAKVHVSKLFLAPLGLRLVGFLEARTRRLMLKIKPQPAQTERTKDLFNGLRPGSAAPTHRRISARDERKHAICRQTQTDTKTRRQTRSGGGLLGGCCGLSFNEMCID